MIQRRDVINKIDIEVIEEEKVPAKMHRIESTNELSFEKKPAYASAMSSQNSPVHHSIEEQQQP